MSDRKEGFDAATYIFMDVDGVLIKCFPHDPEYRRYWNAHLERDVGISTDALQTYFFRRHWSDVINGRRDLAQALTEILPDLGGKGSAQDIINSWLKADSILDTELLSQLARVKQRTKARLYLATNQERNRADYLWTQLKFSELFAEMFYSGKLGTSKSDPLFFAKINDALALDPDRDTILFFDDAPQNVRVARDCGWLAFQYETVKDFAENPYVTRLLGADMVQP